MSPESQMNQPRVETVLREAGLELGKSSVRRWYRIRDQVQNINEVLLILMIQTEQQRRPIGSREGAKVVQTNQCGAHKNGRKEVTTIPNTEKRMTLSYVCFIVPL